MATDGNDWLLFDAGPIADGLHADATPSTAHGHLDTLQVLYFAGGRDMLIDPGMPNYFGDREWVRHFRSAAAHNTIEIEGVSLAKDVGRLEWSLVANRPRLQANFNDDARLASGRVVLDAQGTVWSSRVVLERNLLCLPGRGLWTPS